ncbi:GNAT family N-acetyltransferase [Aeromicrobium sp. PE09-221]|uniref:GNAT family N-acetyltransferase n=1 Tax=Aeromicrobium sp. PE09-221 TaxID=1898043 RepID=UPI000B3E709F|nr:GNAT family N-acetyltransferase [Aeromicrobium sp. PE09-221]OUZ07973.1 GNAT family N-acetyltransferase [Aeromicrobium sp. PE09-221]
MTTADVSARLAWPDDVEAIAALQAESWRESFTDVLGDQLDSLRPHDLAERWRQVIAAPRDARQRVIVALERATVRGFALVHPCHDEDADRVADGEIGEFVIDSEHRGQGHGSRLLQACADTLRADRFTRAVWWLGSTDDTTRAFATAAGWAADGAHRELAAETGATLRQVRLHTGLA